MNGHDDKDFDENLDWDAWLEEEYPDYDHGLDPLLPVSGNVCSSNLPAKLTAAKKTLKRQLPLDWEYKPKKRQEEIDTLREEREERIRGRTEDAKKVSWKMISRSDEYEVLVQGVSLGRVREDLKVIRGAPQMPYTHEINFNHETEDRIWCFVCLHV